MMRGTITDDHIIGILSVREANAKSTGPCVKHRTSEGTFPVDEVLLVS